MKKVAMWLLALVVSVAGLCSLAACGSITGVYKFYSMKTTQGGISVELKVGETYLGVISLTEDFFVVEINEDGTCTMKENAVGTTVNTQTGTWEEKDGKYVLTFGTDSVTAEIGGGTITFSQDGNEITLKK